MTRRSWNESALQHGFAKVRDATDLQEDLRFRDLRRTGATNLGRGGRTDDEIRSITGHLTRPVIGIPVQPEDTIAQNAMDKRRRTGEKRGRRDAGRKSVERGRPAIETDSPFAGLAQRQCSGFVNRRPGVRIPHPASS